MIASAIQYYWRYTRYRHVLSRVKQTFRYRYRKKLLNSEAKNAKSGKKKGRRNKNSFDDDDDEDEVQEDEDDSALEPQIRLMGIKPPKLDDLVAVRVVLLPVTITKYSFYILRWVVWYKILRRPQPPVDVREVMRDRLGMTEEEFAQYEQEMREKAESGVVAGRGRRRRRR
jgi:hypothetical protein